MPKRHAVELEPPVGDEKIVLRSAVALEDIPGPNRIVYAVDEHSNRVKLMSHYEQMEGWKPFGVIPNGYGRILKGETFWCIQQGKVNVLVSDE